MRDGAKEENVVTKASVHGFNDTVLTLPDSKKGKGLSKIGNVLVSSGLFGVANEKFDDFYKKYYKRLRSNPNTPMLVSPIYK